MTVKYRLKDGTQTGFVPGVGPIVNGIVEGPDGLESANLEKIEEQASQPQPAAPQTVPAAPVASPAAANPAPMPQQPVNKEAN